jgi:hypothetical protein
MKVVHVLRKPCSEGTVAANVLKHGTGALNVNGCRVGYEGTQNPASNPLFRATHGYAVYSGPSTGGPSWTVSPVGRQMSVHTGGRWPANLVLQHLDGCRCEGTREVAADGHFPASRPAGSKVAGASGHVGQQGLEERSPKRETVAAWTCAEGCPVAALDAQSGVLKSGALPSNQYVKGARDNSSIFAGSGVFTHKGYEADVGGASRFFKQFGGDKVHGDPSDG